MSESNQMGQSNNARLSDMSSMIELIQELWYLKRDIVSDDFDRALYRLAQEFDGRM